VQLSVKYETVLNMTTAKALGLDVPTSILLSADEPIESEYRNARRLDRRRSNGSNTSVELSWHVGFTSDSGRIAARQRTDASGQKRTSIAVAEPLSPIFNSLRQAALSDR
jgi:hypothetical protein